MFMGAPDHFQDFDTDLCGAWDAVPDGGPVDLSLMDISRRVILEVKSAEMRQAQSDGDMRSILSEMTVEMRSQFEAFRKLRGAAEAMFTGGDDASQKLARADIKAATDAMSLIVRTLEKIDGLQRQFARDRRMEAEQTADEGGYEQALQEVERLIEARAEERYRRRCIAAGLDADQPGGAAGDRSQPPDTG